MSGSEKTRLAVVGAGPGGYAAAFHAADLGLEVTLIDREATPGGVCLHRGCIPSKALLHAARVLHEARAASAMGIDFGKPRIDREKLRAWKSDVVTRLTSGLAQLARARKVRYVQGEARFTGPHELEVRDAADKTSSLAFDHAILATGSAPVRLAFLPDSPRILDSTGALDLASIPARLLVVGGGYIGLELGCVYAALGSRVTVVEMTPHLLPGVDPDLVRPLARRLGQDFDAIHLETRLASVEDDGKTLRARLEGKGAPTEPLELDAALVAVGRRPVTKGLGLEQAGVKLDEHGFVAVDAERRTSAGSILAIGDVTGQPMLAHKASHEGRVAAAVVAGQRSAYEPRAIPAVVFTDPEIAWCGLTEAEAKAQGREIQVARFPWAASGRALTLGAAEGLTKLIVEPSSGRVLGVGLCGAGAGELIAEGVLAVEMGATAEDLSLTIHAHPTLSETLMEAADVFLGSSTHVYRKPG